MQQIAVRRIMVASHNSEIVVYLRSTFALMVLASAASPSLCLAQDAVVPGTGGTAPVTRGTGVGPDSAVTGSSESGRGGTGGMGGGATTNGTAAGAGTATGGNPSGYPDRN